MCQDKSSSSEPRSNGNEIPGWCSEDIVISGLSGRFPESNNVEEFRRKLFDGIDLITEDDRRWPTGLHGLPARTGKLPDLEHFDATFFSVHAKQANVMDPQLRMLLELTYESIIDAGANPQDIRGSRTGVFIGVTTNESDEFWAQDPETINGYGLLGCHRAMLANRISFAFDFHGPSYPVDTACGSSMFALQQAFIAMRTGQCDAAIVGGVNLLLKPANSLHLHRLNMLSPIGICKSFDESGDGYVRSEAAVVIFLQRASQAKRIYATVINAKTNADGAKEEGIAFPSGAMIKNLIEETYAEVGINPADVAYVEAHGTGTKAGDPQEVNSIVDVFTKDRNSPLLIGSVKSNMGHSEAAAGLCSIAKIIIAMEAGMIPANLHFNIPNPDIPGLWDNRLQVVNKSWPWNGGLVGVNSFGFGGANAHIILRSNAKCKSTRTHNNIPYIAGVSGRTQEAVDYKLTNIEETPRDADLIALIHGIYTNPIPGHSYRGYTVRESVVSTKEVTLFDGQDRPVWYVFSGIGSQWAGMSKTLMQLDVFSHSISQCADALRPKGFDLISVLSSESEDTFENILNCFVSITAMQIALVNVLTSLGISPNGIVGHSCGEIVCAYADGTFTVEQAILASFWRGRSILESKLPLGSMATVGLSWEKTKAKAPDDIVAACHNSAESVTISGPPDSVANFVSELRSEGVFAKIINSSGVAAHSKYIAEAATRYRKHLEKIIPSPKPRTSRWISTSVPEVAWDSALAQTSSANYHVNNLLSPVLFYEALTHIPKHAVVIEISPHSLFQANLKQSLGPDSIIVSLLKKGTGKSNVSVLLSSLGRLYNAGLSPDFAKLYPSFEFPVARGTPMIQSLVKWDHSTAWAVPSFVRKSSSSDGVLINIDLTNDNDSYLDGHVADGRSILPASSYIVFVWKAFAKMNGKPMERVPVILEDIQYHRATILHKEGSIRFSVHIFEDSGEFKLVEEGCIVFSGNIRIMKHDEEKQSTLAKLTDFDTTNIPLTKHDVNKELYLRGADFGVNFQNVMEADNKGVVGKLTWKNNWITFIDAVIIFSVIEMNTRKLCHLARVQRIAINPETHFKCLRSMSGKEKAVPVSKYKSINLVKSGGVEIQNMTFGLTPRKHLEEALPKLEHGCFVPYVSEKVSLTLDNFRALTASVQIVLDNIGGSTKLKIIEVATNRQPDNLLVPHVVKIIESKPLLSMDINIVSNSTDALAPVFEPLGIKSVFKDVTAGPVDQDCHLVVATNYLNNPIILANMAASVKKGGFILFEESYHVDENYIKDKGLEIISKIHTDGTTYVLLKTITDTGVPIKVTVIENDFTWLEELKSAMKQSEAEARKILIVVQGDPLSGIVGLINCIRHEPGGLNVRSVFIHDKDALEFSLTDNFYATQINKDLLHNVLKNKQWGCYHHFILDDEAEKAARRVEHAYINALTYGDLSNLKWIEAPLPYNRASQHPDKELCHIYYAPVNCYDFKLASGKLLPNDLPGDLEGQDCNLGLEFAGRDTEGRRVMGLVAGHALATTVFADRGFMWEVPEKWGLDEASTIPLAYSIAYYALFVKGSIQPGDKLLVQTGSGGFDQAAIIIALHMGCTVFTIVGSEAERNNLKKTFPRLSDRNIADSHGVRFEQHVMIETQGRGVDFILTSSVGEMLQTLVRCLAKDGKCCKIGKPDLSNSTATTIGMSAILKNTTFHNICLDSLFDVSCENVDTQEVRRLMTGGLENGVIQPFPVTCFSEEQVEQAFRLVGSEKYTGKIVLKIRDEESRKTKAVTPKCVHAVPRTYMNPDKSYLIVGGLGGIGLELAKWLISRGATKLLLTSARGVRLGYQSLCIRRWKESGINVDVSTIDCSTVASATTLIEEASKLGPVGGIFNLAAVLSSGPIHELTPSDFQKVALPKISGTKNLDQVSRKLCPQLDHFVAFSSTYSSCGTVGMANYGLADSAMERICEARQEAGFPGVAIQWGPIGDVGFVLDSLGHNNNSVIDGFRPQRISSLLAVMDIFLRQPHPVLASSVIAERGQEASISKQAGLTDAIAKILGIKDKKTVNRNLSLGDLGMDSLLVTEIQQTLERIYDVAISIREIPKLTFGRLFELESS